jgi:uncharacterized membrane protein
MSVQPAEVARRLFRRAHERRSGVERRVMRHLTENTPISRDTQQEFEDERTLGQRAADRIAAFGGSWTFLGLFALVLASWVLVNSLLLRAPARAFDPYPYILLNLFLSMLAAIQAPVIMMSQNRQSAKDRLDASHDYEVNLKAEIEIRSLHEKLDLLRKEEWLELVVIQQQQIQMLERLLERVEDRTPEAGESPVEG